MFRATTTGTGGASSPSHRNSLSTANLGYQVFSRCLLPWLDATPETDIPPPVVIGAIGGSGTRLLVRILRQAGYWMGAWCNPVTEDAMAPRGFMQQHFETLIRRPAADDPAIDADFNRAIRAHRWRMPDRRAPWGWKNPRTLWIIPFLARHYPRMIFIHLVRDGRDMALSSNHNLRRKHAHLLLAGTDWRADPVAAQLRLWALGNRLAWETGRALLGERHLVLRYEDLCAAPRAPLSRLFEQLCPGMSTALEPSVETLIIPSPGIGRWRASDHAALRHPPDDIREVLDLFGYPAH